MTPLIAAIGRIVEDLDGQDVASIGDLIALKVLSRDDDRRPQDAADLRALCRAATEADVGVARETLTLITARGFHRGRELDVLFERALQAFVSDGG